MGPTVPGTLSRHHPAGLFDPRQIGSGVGSERQKLGGVLDDVDVSRHRRSLPKETSEADRIREESARSPHGQAHESRHQPLLDVTGEPRIILALACGGSSEMDLGQDPEKAGV